VPRRDGFLGPPPIVLHTADFENREEIKDTITHEFSHDLGLLDLYMQGTEYVNPSLYERQGVAHNENMWGGARGNLVVTDYTRTSIIDCAINRDYQSPNDLPSIKRISTPRYMQIQ